MDTTNITTLVAQIKEKKSTLCVGLDTDILKIPHHLHSYEDPIFEFNKAIIAATSRYAVAFKINTAFYESEGIKGWRALEKTISFLNEKYPEIFTIADAKRGDIGNTSRMYAKTFFEYLKFNAVTIAPYMGEDSVSPFLEYSDKTPILLGLTSNKGAFDFQTKYVGKKPLYEEVIRISQKWKNSDRLMYVVGATRVEYIKKIRKLIPSSFLLIPGVGKQGGSLQEVCKQGLIKSIYGLLINSSRSIIYASAKEDFARLAGLKAKQLQELMADEIKKIN